MPKRPTGRSITAARDPRWRTRVWTVGLTLVVLTGVSLACLTQGSVTISVPEVWSELLAPEPGVAGKIVWTLRLPRLLLGLLIGMSLALSGALLQGVMQNPLADPGIIGVSAGGGLVAVIVLILFPHASAWLPAVAALGGLAAALGIYAIAWRSGAISPLRVILAGVAVNAFLASWMALLMILFSEQVPAVLPWLAGSLSGRSWPQVQTLWPYALATAGLALLSARTLNVLGLGEERAASLGLRVTLARLALSALAALLAAGVVSVAGLIGFVGLIVPHFCRFLVGGDHRILLVTSALVGAALVVGADLVARLILSPLELPVGLMLALVGAPYFLWLLRRGI